MATATAKIDLVRFALAPSETERDKAARTHKIICEHLANDPSLDRYDIDTYLHGSYKNRTNVRGDSDVDIGSRSRAAFWADVSRLSTRPTYGQVKSERDLYEDARCSAGFSFWDYRRDVLASLTRGFGADSIEDGDKAIKVRGNSSRIDSDVLPCLHYRHFYRYTGSESDYDTGIAFLTQREQKQIVNFPDQHYQNLTDKNQDGDEKVKGCIRIFKRVRNGMIDAGAWERSKSPSYYLECLVWNAPTHLFRQPNYQDVVAAVLRFLWTDLNEKGEAGATESYVQANKILPLFGPDYLSYRNAVEFLEALWQGIFGR